MVVMTVGMAPSQLRPWVFPWLSEVLDVLAASSWLLVGDDGGPGGNTGLSAKLFEVSDVTSMSAETAQYPVECAWAGRTGTGNRRTRGRGLVSGW